MFENTWCDLGKSVWSRTCDIFNFLFDWIAHLGKCILLKTLPNQTSGSKVMSNWVILKTIENKRNSFVFLAISHNQCSRLPTDSIRSQHITLLSVTILKIFIICYHTFFLTLPVYTLVYKSEPFCKKMEDWTGSWWNAVVCKVLFTHFSCTFLYMLNYINIP